MLILLSELSRALACSLLSAIPLKLGGYGKALCPRAGAGRILFGHEIHSKLFQLSKAEEVHIPCLDFSFDNDEQCFFTEHAYLLGVVFQT